MSHQLETTFPAFTVRAPVLEPEEFSTKAHPVFRLVAFFPKIVGVAPLYAIKVKSASTGVPPTQPMLTEPNATAVSNLRRTKSGVALVGELSMEWLGAGTPIPSYLLAKPKPDVPWGDR